MALRFGIPAEQYNAMGADAQRAQRARHNAGTQGAGVGSLAQPATPPGARGNTSTAIAPVQPSATATVTPPVFAPPPTLTPPPTGTPPPTTTPPPTVTPPPAAVSGITDEMLIERYGMNPNELLHVPGQQAGGGVRAWWVAKYKKEQANLDAGLNLDGTLRVQPSATADPPPTVTAPPTVTPPPAPVNTPPPVDRPPTDSQPEFVAANPELIEDFFDRMKKMEELQEDVWDPVTETWIPKYEDSPFGSEGDIPLTFSPEGTAQHQGAGGGLRFGIPADQYNAMGPEAKRAQQARHNAETQGAGGGATSTVTPAGTPPPSGRNRFGIPEEQYNAMGPEAKRAQRARHNAETQGAGGAVGNVREFSTLGPQAGRPDQCPTACGKWATENRVEIQRGQDALGLGYDFAFPEMEAESNRLMALDPRFSPRGEFDVFDDDNMRMMALAVVAGAQTDRRIIPTRERLNAWQAGEDQPDKELDYWNYGPSPHYAMTQFAAAGWGNQAKIRQKIQALWNQGVVIPKYRLRPGSYDWGQMNRRLPNAMDSKLGDQNYDSYIDANQDFKIDEEDRFILIGRENRDDLK